MSLDRSRSERRGTGDASCGLLGEENLADSVAWPTTLPALRELSPRAPRQSDVAILATGNAAFAASQWVILVTIAKLGTPADVGRYALGLALTAPVFLFLNLQLRNLIATDATRSVRDSEYVRLRLACATLAVVASVVLILVLPLDTTVTGISLALLVAKSAESASDLAYGFFQRDRRFISQAKSMTFRGLGGALLFTLAFLHTGSVSLGVLALSVAWWLLFVVHDCRHTMCFAALTGGANWRSVGSLARLALPMGIVSMLVSLNANIPRYVIEAMLGADALGFFAAILFLVLATNLLVSAVSSAVAPRLGDLAARGRIGEFRVLMFRLLGLGVGFGLTILVLAVVAGEAILAFLYTTSYAQYDNILIILVSAGAFGYCTWFLATGLTALRSLRIQLPISLVAVLTTALACFLLTPSFGLTGAAVAVAIGSAAQFGFAAIATERAMRCAERSSWD